MFHLKKNCDGVFKQYWKVVDDLKFELEFVKVQNALLIAENKALDQGRDELEEAFQQDMLDVIDTVQKQEHTINILTAVVEEHEKNCLLAL